MGHLRITKYNPMFRDKKDVYSKNEWFNYGCIGTIYEDKIVTIEDYEIVESKYLKIVEIAYIAADSPELFIHNLENNDEDNELENDVKDIIKKGKISTKQELLSICKSIFRLLIWCELFTVDCKFGIKIYSDMYLFIFSDDDKLEKTLKTELPQGLYLE